MSKRDLLSLSDLSREEFIGLLRRGELHRTGALDGVASLKGKSLAMLFSKASTRTRVSFDVGMFQLGGHAVVLSDRDTQIGRGEPVQDTARVLSGYVDGIMIRTFEHAQIEALAQWSSVPVINGLTDFNHPCQVLADLLTCRTEFGEARLSDLIVTWIGDGNNMTRSWVNAAQVLGFELRLCSPQNYALDESFLAVARSHGAHLTCFTDPVSAATGAHVITTDVWASMGDEAELDERVAAFKSFIVDEAVMRKAASDSIFLHCLPVHRGEEASAVVVDGPHSRVWQEAANRLHVQKAILEWTLGELNLD
jgi:ornithine carbamoyltransferase